jgi:hypothetical protein
LISFEEIRQKADEVRDIDLIALLSHCGSKDLQDKAKWHTAQGVISVNNQKFINWSSGTGGGGAIDLAMHLQKFDFKNAVLWLYQNFASCKNIYPQAHLVKHTFKLPQKDKKKLPHVTQYLVNKRCIPKELIQNLINSNKLYADIKSNAVFLLLGKKKRVVGAELKGTRNKQWRGMARGSQKNDGCFYIVGRNTTKMVLCESAIDAISFAVLNPEYTAISTAGATANPAWLQDFILNGCKIYCGFDADKAGDAMANKMVKLHPSITRLRPSKHDWNDVLRASSLKLQL